MGGRKTRNSRRVSSSQPEAERVEMSESEGEMGDEPIVRDGTSSLPDGGFSALSEETQDQLVMRMIRLMVCRHAVKKPVPRTEIRKYLFTNMTGIKSRQKVFSGTFSQAQNKLRSTFGMEMLEIQKLIKQRASQSQRTQSMSQGVGANGMKGFILVSVLPAELRVEDKRRKGMMAFLTVVGGMILLEAGCRIKQESLYRALGKIGVYVREKGGHKQLNDGNVKELMEKILPGQWYLEREREESEWYYTLGPRFRAEIQDNDLIEFINAVYTGNGTRDGWLDETSRKELQMRLDQAYGVNQDADEMET